MDLSHFSSEFIDRLWTELLENLIDIIWDLTTCKFSSDGAEGKVHSEWVQQAHRKLSGATDEEMHPG